MFDAQPSAKRPPLYRSSFEHDNCGIGACVNIKGQKSRATVENALRIVENLEHRAGKDAEGKTGDGVGILTQVSHKFFSKVTNTLGFSIGKEREYGVGMFFFPQDELQRNQAKKMFEIIVEKEGMEFLGWREVPTYPSVLGHKAIECMPYIMQAFIKKPDNVAKGLDFDRKLYIVRRVFEQSTDVTYVVSLSSRTIVYKGMFLVGQLRTFFKDLQDEDYESAIAIVHSRFSTNTNPSWERAHPNRFIVHNGEINTIRGNRSWMESREGVLHPDLLCPLEELGPVVQRGMSDSASLDNVLEFFVQSGMTLPHALAMLIPESYNDKNPISAELKAFYEYHSIFMEPWDGPATLLFSDGRYAGGMLDRNGLRPARYFITKNDMMVVASETGTFAVEASEIREKGRLRPGKILMIDTEKGEIRYDPEIKEQLAAEHPYKEWLGRNRVVLNQITSGRQVKHSVEQYDRMLRVFGYNREDVEKLIKPMGENGFEPLGSMGNDTPLAILSAKPQRLFNYFRQQFALICLHQRHKR